MLRDYRAFVLFCIFFFQPFICFSGIYSVVSSELLLHDSSRNRNIPLKIYYPLQRGHERFPILIFSHGAGGSKEGYSYLSRYWATNGYVVINPTHLGSDNSFLKKGRFLFNLRAMKQMVKVKSNLVNRPQDISFIKTARKPQAFKPGDEWLPGGATNFVGP